MPVVSLVVMLLAQVNEPERVVLTGTIVDVAGKPAAQAKVVLAEGLPPSNELARRSGAVLRPPAVLGRERAGSQGEFRIPLPGDDLRVQRYRRPRFLWIFGPDASLGLRPIPDDWPPDGEPVRVTLAASQPVRLRIVGPDDRPVAGARLAPARARGIDIPDELSARFEVVSDANGRATIAAGPAADLEVIRAIAGPSGTQQLPVARADADGVHSIRLFAAGRVAGRVEAGDPRAVRGLTVRLRTDPDPSADIARVGGLASVVTDEEGRFTVPAMAAGKLAISVDFRWDLPWRSAPLLLSQPQVEATKTTEVTIALKPASRVTGVVQEAPAGRPIANVGIALTLDVDTPLAPTDAAGRFSAYLAPRAVLPYPVGVPRGYYRESSLVREQLLHEGVKELTLKPEELNRGATAHGQVIDAQGKPVAAADVAGDYDDARGFGRFVHAVTDRQGRFRIDSVPPGATLHLSASHGGATTAAPESCTVGKELITLKTSTEHAVALYGRVKDSAGKPLARAIVRVVARKLNRRETPTEAYSISFDDEGRTTLHTDADGQFRTPRQLRPDLQYRVEIAAEDYMPSSTEWVRPDEFRQRYFPGIVLQPVAPTRTVAGRAIDDQGRPAAGAVVFQSGDGPVRTRCLTGADGRFQLLGVYREPAFLFVEGDGLAFQGYRIEPRTESIELNVRRIGEPLGAPLRTLAPVMPGDEQRALALKLIEGDLTPLTGKIEPAESALLCRALPRLDIERALELIDNKSVPDPWYDGFLRIECAKALFGEDPAAAAAIAEAVPEIQSRFRFYRDASDALPKAERARKLGLLDKALVHARAIKEPATKLVMLGMVGYRLLDLRETERGTQVHREGQRLADTLPKPVAGQRNPAATLRGQFAAKLARIDAAAAFALAEGYSDPAHDSCLGGVALGLANRDPAGCERALGMFRTKVRRDQIVTRAAGRMAAIDRARARRLAEALERPRDQALALASMARGLAGPDPKAAIGLLDEALSRLTKSVENGREQPRPPRDVPCLVAAEMLPLAEQLDPELLRRCFWQAIALRPPRPAGNDTSFAYEQAASSLAIRLARYDRSVARQILEPAARRVRSLDYGRRSWARILFAAATVIDPSWAVSLADSLPEDQPAAELHPKTSMRRVIADVLAHGSPDQWDDVYRAQLNEYVFWQMYDSKDEER